MAAALTLAKAFHEQLEMKAKNIRRRYNQLIIASTPALEAAHYDYLDYYALKQDSDWAYISFESFFRLALDYCKDFTLHKKGINVTDELGAFNKNKKNIPVAGALIINEAGDKCLMVTEHWTRFSQVKSLSLARGKVDIRILPKEGEVIAREESTREAARREVKEETGLDIEEFIDDDIPKFERIVGLRTITLYIVHGVPENHPSIQPGREIDQCIWVELAKIAPRASQNSSVKYFENEEGHLIYETYQFLDVIANLRG